MALKHAILAAVSLEPQTGYELGKQINGSIRFFWAATLQQIYKELGELGDAGLLIHTDVHQADKPSRKVYRITDSGLKELKTWIEAESDPSPVRDALAVKMFVGHLAAPRPLLKDLQRHVEIHESKLAHYEDAQEKYFADVDGLSVEGKFRHLVLMKGMLMERAWLAWAKEAAAFLAQCAAAEGRK
jgi:PadR family transcriptional regulator, regulatory protein AphA